MSATARLAVERKSETGAGWVPVVSCNSIEYASKVAEASVRCGAAAQYRVVDVRSGKKLSLVLKAVCKKPSKSANTTVAFHSCESSLSGLDRHRLAKQSHRSSSVMSEKFAA